MKLYVNEQIIETTDNHPYFITDLGIWVHNTNGCETTDVKDRSGKKIGETHYFQKDVIDRNKYVPTHFQYIDSLTERTRSDQHFYFND